MRCSREAEFPGVRFPDPNPAVAAPTPGWVVEGIADYIRWFLYEPETRGAEITRRALPRARYDGNYRVSANFIDWVTRNGDAELVRHLNAAARQGTYRDTLWHDRTGKSLQQLGEEWLAELQQRLDASRGADP